MKEVYITRAASFFPNELVSNDEMESFVGKIDEQRSRSRAIVLRNNGIKGRYYALDKEGKGTHTNSELSAESIKNLFKDNPDEIKEIDLLSCGTSSPDQFMPSHGVMVHGDLPEMNSIEVNTSAGVCCSSMHALKYAFASVKAGIKGKVVVSGSERFSRVLVAEQFEPEVEHEKSLEQNGFIGFNKDFLRWMLSDGAGALLVEDKKSENGISLRIDWMESISHANEEETCMYMAADKKEDGTLISYKDLSPDEIRNNSILSIKQDVKLLREKIVSLGSKNLKRLLAEKNIDSSTIDHFLIHMSSFFFQSKIHDSMKEAGVPIEYDRWYTNLKHRGNIGAAAIFTMIDELITDNKLKKGEKILISVPESSRFSYVYTHLTVV